MSERSQKPTEAPNMHLMSREPRSWTCLVLSLFLLAQGGNSKFPYDAGLGLSAEVCESKTINYITHTLPQKCLRTTWTSPTPTVDAQPAELVNDTAGRSSDTQQYKGTEKKESGEQKQEAAGDGAKVASKEEEERAREEEDRNDLATSSFMSFEEWKEMMLRKSGQDPAQIKGRKQREHEHRGGDSRDPGLGNGGIDAIGDDGELDLDFDALSEKVSELAGSTGAGRSNAGKDSGNGGSSSERLGGGEEPVLYDNGKTQYYRSKDAGKTCKERFSYSSFDAGATVLKTSLGAKNAKALLVENKDSYMLLECHTKNKFVIVELSDDILVDTVVLANFEFFSSMIRKFRVSVSDRYPVKADKWVDLGTFEARNSRDIQPFLVEHPQIYTKYVKIEFLSHYGNEYYCPVSLLRVHGTRMLDSWKEADTEETIDPPPQEERPEEAAAQQPAEEFVPHPKEEKEMQEEVYAHDTGLSLWDPTHHEGLQLETCAASSPTTISPTIVSADGNHSLPSPGDSLNIISEMQNISTSTETSQPSQPSSPVSSTQALSSPDTGSTVHTYSVTSTGQASGNSTSSGSSQKQTSTKSTTRSNSVKSNTTDIPSSSKISTTPTTSRNKTTITTSQVPASPTVQESFFKTVSKRLQLLESNTSLSLQYIQDQSRFLQEALTKMEKKQAGRVDSFLDGLNRTVLADLRNIRTQYDQIWQSTVIALETQREQAQREIVALTGRLNVLADEVVFQKRMAILQSLLLLACLILVVFSRSFGPGGASAWDMAMYQYQTHHRAGSLSGPSPGRGAEFASMGMMPVDSPPLSAGLDYATDHANSPRPVRPEGVTERRNSGSRHMPSRRMSYHDKVLPLTPTSEYESDPMPIIRVDEVDVPFFHDVGGGDTMASETGGVADGADAHSDAKGGNSERERFPGVEGLTPPPPHVEGGENSGEAGQEETLSAIKSAIEVSSIKSEAGSVDELGSESGPERKPVVRRATFSQVGAVKPLPALPEDPS